MGRLPTAAGIPTRVTAHSGRVGLASELTAPDASTTGSGAGRGGGDLVPRGAGTVQAVVLARRAP